MGIQIRKWEIRFWIPEIKPVNHGQIKLFKIPIFKGAIIRWVFQPGK